MGREGEHWALFGEWNATLANLGGAAALLGWDRETAMPRGGAESRAAQMGTLSALLHRELVRPDAGGAIEELAANADLDAESRAMLWWAKRERDRAVRIPEGLVRELSEARSRAVSAWSEARPKGDVASYVLGLRPVVALRRRYAEAIGGDGELYDALLDEYEPGARIATVEPLLNKLADRIRPLVEPAADASPDPLPAATWPPEAQVALARELAEMVGFDLDRGAVAQSAHPFTTAFGDGDVRFTTRVDEANPVSNIRAVLHEAGHALYEQGLPSRYAQTPLHDAPSLGAHESQSLFWENHVGGTDGFWTFLAPALERHFPEAMRRVSAGTIAAAARRVRPSLIRVEADEVTYNLHIVLRFRLELAMMRGELGVEDLPEAFDDGLEGLLGVRAPRPADGVMQDVHWPEGLIGYFPTYTLGHLYAAQLGRAAHAELGSISDAARSGSLAEVLAFLRERVHSFGRLQRTDELMRQATGVDLGPDAFVEHLRARYLPG